MPIKSQLASIWDYAPNLTHNHFLQHIPAEWIESALELTQQASIRRRRLPADMVLWLVIGMAFFRNEPIDEVARRLNICAEGLANEVLLAKSGISKARERLGEQPMSWLFQQCAARWGTERYPEDTWNGLQVFAVDGALLRTQDTESLRAHFGSGNTASDRQTPFPMLRLVAVMNARSHVILDAVISPYRSGEIRLAEHFYRRIPTHSVTLLDKGFWGADLLLSLHTSGEEKHWLIPARHNVVAEVVEDYGPGDRLVVMTVSPQARKKNPALPAQWTARAVTYLCGDKEKTVMTSLPIGQFSAQQIAGLYHERWEIELGFRDIKSAFQHNAMTLRSKKVALVYQELWGVLLGYNLIRREASQAAVAHQQVPADVSFKFAYQYIAAQLIVMAGALSPGHTPRRLAELRGNIAALFIQKRPRPSRPRAVKISKTRYPVNHKAAPLK